MAFALFEVLTEEELDGILSCLNKFSSHNHTKIMAINEPFVIAIWFADMARQYLKSNAQDGTYDIIPKMLENFRNLENKNFVINFDRTDRILVEIMKNGAAKFFSIDKFNFAIGHVIDLQLEQF